MWLVGVVQIVWCTVCLSAVECDRFVAVMYNVEFRMRSVSFVKIIINIVL